MKAILTLTVIASQFFTSFGQTLNSTDKLNVQPFIGKYSQFKMDIQAAGIATIPAATFDNDVLIIEYAYFSEGENRKGKMTLTFNSDTNRFEGNWQTNADNGNVYKGSLYFLFRENGGASGKYKFANRDYKITIFKASK